MNIFKKPDPKIEEARVERVKAQIAEAKEKRIKKEQEVLIANRKKAKAFILKSSKLKAIIAEKSCDSNKLIDSLLTCCDIYVSGGALQKSDIQNTDVIDALIGIEMIIRNPNRSYRFCTIDHIEAGLLNPIGVFNKMMNTRILKKCDRNFLYSAGPDGKVVIKQHPKYEPLTEDQKAILYAKAKEDEHRKRVGVSTATNAQITDIMDGVEIELARVRAERRYMIETYKPYMVGLVIALVVIWLINGMSNM
jgi:hypothetical protein